MALPNVSDQIIPWSWRRFALKWFSFGIGIGVIVVATAGLIIWFNSRPNPPKLWNTEAVIAKNPPGFFSSSDRKKIRFEYSVQNMTADDYEVSSNRQIKILIKSPDGSFSRPVPDDVVHLDLPVFIPAKQTGSVILELSIAGIPTMDVRETDEAYHERLRAFCEEQLTGIGGFDLFDDINKYQIIFPRWLSVRPK